MMRTEVKIGISVAVLLVVVVVAYVVIGRDGDAGPAGNQSDNRVAVANKPASGLNYGEPAGEANRSSNAAWPSNRASNTASGQTGVFGNNNYTFNAANAANTATANTGGFGSYNVANNAANSASTNGSFTTVYNAASNAASGGAGEDWVDFNSSWVSNGASNAASNQFGGTTGGIFGPTPVPADQTRTYTVKAGDSGFWGIAAKPEVYGDGKFYTLLEEANKGVDSRRLAVGTVLKVPPLPKATQATVAAGGVGTSADGSKVYTVVDGDSLFKIAGKTLGGETQANVDALIKANPGLTANIKPGQKITLPDSATVAPGPATGTPRTNATATTPRTGTTRPANTSADGAPRPSFNR
jgi:LysM repeat protein